MTKEEGPRKLLGSWKEISAYLGCDVRTCSRWEKTLGLPVHRLEGARKSRVHAYGHELDAWRKSKENNHSLDIRKRGRSPVWRAAFLGLSLALVGTAVFFGYRKAASPREPADFKIEGSALVILNNKGGEMWRFETGVEGLVDGKVYRDHYQGRKSTPYEVYLPYLIIRDITGDGRAEVLFAPKTGDAYREGSLFCFDRRGRELWRFRLGRPIRFGPQDYADFSIHGFIADDLDGDGRAEVIVNSNARGFFPNQLAILGSEGKLRGEYWNSGHLRDIAFVDLERDGRKEIVVSGQNNEYEKGCLIVFDADGVAGCSPQSVDKFVSPGIPAGTQRAYVLFPRSDVGLSEFPTENATPIDVVSNDLIIVHMNFTALIFELGFDLVPRIARTSHTFEQLHKVARREGRVSSVLDDAYVDALRRGVLFWTGTGWSSEPSVLAR